MFDRTVLVEKIVIGRNHTVHILAMDTTNSFTKKVLYRINRYISKKFTNSVRFYRLIK